MEGVLDAVYSDPRHPGSFSGPDKLKRGAFKGKKYHVTIKKVKDWLKGKDAYTYHRVARKKIRRNPIIAEHIDAQWQGDLAEVGNLSHKNDGVRYLMILIDIVSKHVWVEPLKTKSGPDVLAAFRKVFEKTERRPLRLQTDDGKEFLNHHVQKFFKDNNISFFTVKSDKKAAVAERVVRTLKEKIYRYMYEKNTRRYLDVLQDLVSSYNDTYHKAIKMAPSEVNTSNEGRVLGYLYGKYWFPKTGINRIKKEGVKVGDLVRISKLKGVFDKGYIGNWTEEVFIVDKIIESEPRRWYKLKDWGGEVLEGSFYDEEIQVVHKDLKGYWKVEKVIRKRIVRGKKEYFVKWEGYPESMNSWVKEKDMKSIGEDEG